MRCEHQTGMQVYQLDTGREDRKRQEGRKDRRKPGQKEGRLGKEKSSLVGQFVKMLLEEVPGQITT